MRPPTNKSASAKDVTDSPKSVAGGSHQGIVRRHYDAEELANADLEANYFAMCLLMPEEWVRRELKRMGGSIDIGDDKKMKILAAKFGVSITVMTLRLGQISGNLNAI